MTTFIGIDPGLSGAIAALNVEEGELYVYDMPTLEVTRNSKNKREISASLLFDILRDHKSAELAILERVGAMPGQGVSSTFQFGRSVGIVEGVLASLGLPVKIVSPKVWQAGASVRGGKDGSRQRAIELFPRCANTFARKKDDGRADAALMAWYAATK